MSKTLILCHVVFVTKNRKPTLNLDHKRDLYSFFYNILKENKCWTYRINGLFDHVHILFDLNSTIALASLMKELKWNSSKWLHGNDKFPIFEGWGEGYFAVSVSPQDKDRVIEYITNQQKHHAKYDSYTELENLIVKNGMVWHKDDWD